MSYSKFHPEAPDFNKNYKPLEKEHPSLQYYFKVLLSEMPLSKDNVFKALLNHYISLANKKTTGRLALQGELAQKMRSTLESTLPQNFSKAFDILNEFNQDINPKDDFIWLLSAYCSVFPFANRMIKNTHIKKHLSIHDINDMYLQTVLMRFLTEQMAYSALRSILLEIAYFSNKYEDILNFIIAHHWDPELAEHTDHEILFEMPERANTKQLERITRHNRLLNDVNDLLVYATPEQTDRIFLPIFLSAIKNKEKPENKHDMENEINIHLEAMSSVLEKVSVETLENKILPRLLEIFEWNEVPIEITTSLKTCIKRMHPDSLKRSVLPFCMAYFSDDKNNVYDDLHRKAMLKSLFIMMCKFSKTEHDKIAEKILSYGKTSVSPHFYSKQCLTILKDLRQQKLYVNDQLFQEVAKNVAKNIDAELLYMLKANKFDFIDVEHITGEQIQRLFSFISSLNIYEVINNVSFLRAFKYLASTPSDIYPKSFWMPYFDYILQHRDEPKFQDILIAYLSVYDFSEPNSRKILIELCQFAIKGIETSNEDRKSRSRYYQLLEVCTSRMTEQELSVYVVSFLVGILKTPHFCYVPYTNVTIQTTDHIDEMKKTLVQVLNNIHDQDFHKAFYSLLQSVTKDQPSKYRDLFELIINKMSPEELPYICRNLLKTDLTDERLEFATNILICVYKRNKALYADMPEFCKGMIEAEVVSKSHETKCAVM